MLQAESDQQIFQLGHINQVEAPPTSLICLRAPLEQPPAGLGQGGSRKKPAAAAVNPGNMTKPIRPFKV